MTTNERVDHYRDGYNSRQSKQPVTDNPHPKMDDYNSPHSYWFDGWINGCPGGTSPEWYSRTIQGD